MLKLEQFEVDPKKDTPENYLLSLTKTAQRAYPTPDLPAVPSIDAAADTAVEAARFYKETDRRQERLDAVNDHRNDQAKRLFLKRMPRWLRSKRNFGSRRLLQDLRSKARKQKTISEMCPKKSTRRTASMKLARQSHNN